MASSAALKVPGGGRPGHGRAPGDPGPGAGRGLAAGAGCSVETAGREVGLRVNLLVDFGADIAQLGLAVQEAVQEAVETMTGLQVREVEVLVQGVRARGR